VRGVAFLMRKSSRCCAALRMTQPQFVVASAVFSALDLKNVKRNIAEVQRCTANMSKMEEVSQICFVFTI